MKRTSQEEVIKGRKLHRKRREPLMQRKKTSLERKTTSQEDYLTGRLLGTKKITLEEEPKERQPHRQMNYNLIG